MIRALSVIALTVIALALDAAGGLGSFTRSVADAQDVLVRADAGVDSGRGEPVDDPHGLVGGPLTDTSPDDVDDPMRTPNDVPEGPLPDDLPEEYRPSTLTVTADPPSVFTGDAVRLTITAVVREGDDVAVPRQSFAPFEVLDSSAEEPPPEDGRQRFVFHIELLALEPGEHTLAPIPLRVVTKERVLGTVRTEPIGITVQSVLGNEPDAQPKPETAPVEVYEDDYTLAWVGGSIGTLLVLALLMFLFARWWMKREKPAAPPPPPRPAWEVAMERIAMLRRELDTATSEGRLVPWVDRLSDALREYLGDRYGFDGLESTTDEVLSRLRKAKPAGITVEQVGGILSDCDLVKFAKATPERERCVALLDAAEGIVRATTARLGGAIVADPHAKPSARGAGGAGSTGSTSGASGASGAGGEAAGDANANAKGGPA